MTDPDEPTKPNAPRPSEPKPNGPKAIAPTAGDEDSVHLRIRDVQKSYGTQKILTDVTCDIYRGKTNLIIGASGSGKTVLMRQIIRLEKPDAGQIIVDGTDIVPMGEVELGIVRKKFGMVFQMSALFDSMTVFDNVAFLLREHTKMSGTEIRERVMDRLTSLGVAHASQKMPAALSGGMKKRVAVARALVLEPKILIYDEPTTGLDPVTSRTVDELIAETQARYGVTSIVISHDMASVFKIADHINYLYKGHIELSAPPHDFARTDNQAAQEFMRASGVGIEGAEQVAPVAKP
jgi:phospholipid/cholesterol/gamma-HCH transport system ATP-binding protein